MNAAVELLRKVSIFELAGTDGCFCMTCSIQGVDIDVSCRKSSGTYIYSRINPDFSGLVVRAHSSHLDANLTALQAVADEVSRQIRERTGEDIATRLCDYQHDDQMLCCYCDKPRTDAAGYFCNEHKGMERG